MAIPESVLKSLQPKRSLLPKLALRISERRLVIGLGDLAALAVALVAVLALDAASTPPGLSWLSSNPEWLVLLLAMWLVLSPLWDAYDLLRASAPLRSAMTAAGAASLVGLIYWFVPYVPPALPGRRIVILALPLLGAALVAAWRLFYATVFVQPAFQQTALVIGAGRSGKELAQAIVESGTIRRGRRSGVGYRILGYIDDDPTKTGAEIEGAPVLGTREDLRTVVERLRPNELVLSITHLHSLHPALFESILDCRALGVPVTTMASLYERLTGRVPVEHAGRDLHVVMPIAHSASHRVYTALKRLIDLASGLVGSFLVGVLIPFVWVANRASAPGDLFYWQERVGLGGRVFRVIKFRSMVMNAEKDTGAVWAGAGDPRVTPVGRFLRKTRLDEMPQFWNVLKGEMSLVGPRPERPVFVEQLAREIPFYRVRHAVKPGITGWAQVRYEYGASVEDALMKLQYDLYYIKHQGIYLDLAVAIRTVQVMLGLRGR